MKTLLLRILSLSLFLACGGAQAATRPNIILILIDDMGWKDIGFSGSSYQNTPNIDRLARSGVHLPNAYSAAPVCTPSRGSIYTGKSPARIKYTTVYNGEAGPDDRLHEVSKFQGGSNQFLEALHRHALPSTENIFAKTLAESGYATGFYGKWHCGDCPGYYPDQRGFQEAAGYRLNSIGRAGHLGASHIGNVGNLPDLKPDDYLSEILTDKAVSFIQRQKDKPFLLVLSHYLVHAPLEADPESVARYADLPESDQRNPIYAAMIEAVDKSVGRVVSQLSELGLEKNTLVVFASDNGGLTPDQTSNYPVLGGKSFPYEGGTRVPLIFSWPSRIEPGQSVEDRVILTDLYPTFLEAAAVSIDRGQTVDGVSLIPRITGHSGKLSERDLYWHFPHYTHATSPYSSVLSDNWKLIRFYNDAKGSTQLFNLGDDPYELNDRSASEPERRRSLIALLDRKLAEMDAQMPVPNPDYDPASAEVQNLDTSYRLARDERVIFEKRLGIEPKASN